MNLIRFGKNTDRLRSDSTGDRHRRQVFETYAPVLLKAGTHSEATYPGSELGPRGRCTFAWEPTEK